MPVSGIDETILSFIFFKDVPLYMLCM